MSQVARINATMNTALSYAFDVYRRYRAAKAKSKLYRTIRYFLYSLTAAYVLLLCFPQVLFAHQVTYKNFTV